jgi:protein arginine N-methyltransferase 3
MQRARYLTPIRLTEIHATMIQDTVRTSSYATFILSNPHLFENATVMDIGCGTGILSLLAAKAGAKKVWAIEASEEVAKKAETIVKENDYEDVITFVSFLIATRLRPDSSRSSFVASFMVKSKTSPSRT